MSSTTPDAKPSVPPADDAQKLSAASPSRQLNANAKSFEPRLAGSATKEPKTPSAKRNNAPNNAQQQAGTAAAAGATTPMALGQGHPIPLAAIPPLGVPPIAPLAGLAPPLAFPGLLNPMLMQPMLVAALAASASRNLVSPFTAGMGAAPATPLSPMTPATPVINVNVGNASLQALRASGPAKFACVMIVGMPRVGKTTIGQGLITQLEQDGLNWSFFSGGDYLKERAAPWDTTKDIFDALSAKIDMLQSQPNGSVRGLIIDKQCRGTEELYFMTALLRSKGLQLNGVVGLVADDDDKLMERLGETDVGFKEKCKYHRVIQTRIREACKNVGLWHSVDALEDTDVVVRKVRSMILGCSATQPHKQLQPSMYHDGQSPMVDNYTTYASVMGTVVSLARLPKATTFPGFVNLVPLSNSVVAKKSLFKDYAVRRRSDGTKYILVYDGAALYLVPRHMRCVFSLKTEAWLGVPLTNVAKFLLDGDLVRLSKERGKEKFLVQDVICWMDKGATANIVARSTWKERQERLKMNICGEDSAFFASGSDVVVVQQTFVEFKNPEKVFEACDYPTDGFVFQPTLKREDPVYVWRPPETVTVDFRLGPVLSVADGNKKYSLQVFDNKLAKFVSYGNDTVSIPEGRQFVVEGALAICTLKPDEAEKTDGREWTYVRTRTDITTSAFKSYVDDLLANCLIPKATVTAFLGYDPNAPKPATGSGTSTPTPAPVAATPAAANPTAPTVPQPSFQSQRGGIGSALSSGATQTAAAPEPQARPSTAAEALATVVSNVHVAPTNLAGGSQTAPAGRKPRGPVAADALLSDGKSAPRTTDGAANAKRPQKCWGCGKVGEGDVDVGDHKFYCLSCWADFEAGGGATAASKGGRPRTTTNNTRRTQDTPAEGDAQQKRTRRGGGNGGSRQQQQQGDAGAEVSAA